jgi:hypothetical protein
MDLQNSFPRKLSSSIPKIKNMFLKSNFLIATILTLVLQAGISAENVGKIVAMKGKPFAIRLLQKVELNLGDEIQEKDAVRSGAEDSLTLELNNGHRIFILPSTSLVIKTAQEKSTELEQESGSLWCKVKPLSKDSNFHVRTPTAVAGVRGTAFITMVIDPNTTDLCVCEGTVDVTSEGITKSIPQGRGSMITSGKAPSEMVDNRRFIFQRRNLSRKPACMNCHWAGEGDTSHLDENSNIIFK